MLPRFIMKTHTGALRPGNYSILIAKCTFPDKSAYPESVERRLAELLGEGKKSVAKYTVLTATGKNRGFGFLRDNMIWSWKGHVINVVLKYQGKQSDNVMDYLELSSEMERITYLRYFLETEGALILKLARIFADKKEASYSYLKKQIQGVFEEIYQAYIDMAPDLRVRLRIKEMLMETKKQLKSKGYVYDQATLAHKVKPHIEALHDLGLLEIDKIDEKEEIYKLKINNDVYSLAILAEKLDRFDKMEKVFLNDGYFPVIAQALNFDFINFSVELHKDKLTETFLYGYEVMKDRVTGMADIEALLDWCCIKMLSEDKILIGKQEIWRFLEERRKQHPKSIRYHVNGKGRIAYLVLQKGT